MTPIRPLRNAKKNPSGEVSLVHLCLGEESKVVLQTQQGGRKKGSSAFDPRLYPHTILPGDCCEAEKEARPWWPMLLPSFDPSKGSPINPCDRMTMVCQKHTWTQHAFPQGQNLLDNNKFTSLALCSKVCIPWHLGQGKHSSSFQSYLQIFSHHTSLSTQ